MPTKGVTHMSRFLSCWPALAAALLLLLSACDGTQPPAPPPEPSCPAGQVLCSGACVDTTASNEHCGACGNACGSGLTCTTGQCRSVCGDGLLRAPESCDDGNTTPGNGCSATCTVEPGFSCSGEPSTCRRLYYPEAEPNDATASANGPFPEPLPIRGSISSSTDVDLFRFTLTATADVKLETLDGSGQPTCQGIDTRLALLGSNGSALSEDDDSGVNFCSLISSEQSAAARRLAPGTYYARVSSFSGSIPAYSLHVSLEALCGDSRLTGSEQCEDGNTTSGDGCSSACTLEAVAAPAEPNNDPATAPTLSVPALVRGALDPAGDVDVYSFTLASTVDLRLETLDDSGQETCANMDTRLDLLGADGTVVASDDDSGVSLCSLLDASSNERLRRLPAGTWQVRVSAYGNARIPAYRLRVLLTSVCGNGQVRGSEECDGTPGCSATCERTPTCGDGLIDFPEYCDDGNTSGGDACPANCATPSGLPAESEPNATRAEADARPALSSSTLLTAALDPRTDVDMYRLQLSAPTVVRVETFRGGANRCDPGGSTALEASDANGIPLAEAERGIGSCAALALHLQAGTSYVRVQGQGLSGPEAYALEVALQANAGSEAEPNSTTATATPVAGTESSIRGSLSVTEDVDLYRLTVPAGRSLRAELIEGSAQSCDRGEMDGELALLDATGSVLAVDDDSGRGLCSLLEGTGPSPRHRGASNLAAGTYYLRVRASPTSSTTTRVFDYRLSVSLR